MVRDQAVGYFQQALDYFQRCLCLQELQLSDAEGQAHRINDIMTISPGDDAEPAGDVEHSVSDERWALIVEPVTENTLTDTIIAQLETLSALCTVLGSYGGTLIKWIEDYYSTNLKEKVTVYGAASGRQRDTGLARARFTWAFANSAFRAGLVDINTYERELVSSFTSLDFAQDPEALCDKADAEIAVNSSIKDQLSILRQSRDLPSLNNMRWRYLSLALEDLSAASKLANAQNLGRVHSRRGDCEALRYQLGQELTRHGHAFRSTSVLLKNAETYYRGAAGFFRSEGASEEEREAITKEAIVAGLLGDVEKLQPIFREAKEGKSDLRVTIADMEDEGLLSQENAALIASSFRENHETSRSS
jgi:tetratricopeptide (TPR) repeat protein